MPRCVEMAEHVCEDEGEIMPYQNYGCISVYNGEATLERAITSVLNQTYQNIEFIVCDDASTDGTWNILKRFEATDSRIWCFQNDTNIGLGASLNRCLNIATAPYIARQDADDISDPDRLEKTMNFLISSKAPYVACGVRIFDDKGVWSYRQHPRFITKHIIAQKNPFFHPTMLFRRTVLDQVGGYSERAETRRTEDYDLVMRLAARGIIGENLQEILYSVYEPADAYLRHTKKTRWYEIRVRWNGLRMMNAPVRDYVYLLKPVIMGMVPRCCLKQVKRLQWNILHQESRNI